MGETSIVPTPLPTEPTSLASAEPSLRPTALAVDIGGTKMVVGLVDVTGRVIRSWRTPTDPHDPWATLAPVVEGALAVAGAEGRALAVCGVGCGGPMRAGGETVSPLNIEAWREFPLRSELVTLTGLPVFVDNDAKALALAEGWIGAAVGARNYVAMVVSTGVGGGIVVDGRLLDGASGNAGHIGHIVVVPNGRQCGCGARGCLEAEASGRSIAGATGRPPAEAGLDIVERTGRLVGAAVASVAVVLDIPLAVVAGSVALGFGEPFFAAAQAEIDQRCQISFARGCRIRPAGLGSKGPLVGAAAIGWRAVSTTASPGTPAPAIAR